jgi:hypothetical protein
MNSNNNLARRSNIEKGLKTLLIGAACTIIISSVNESVVVPLVNRIIPYIEHPKDTTDINACHVTRSIVVAIVNILFFLVIYQTIHLIFYYKLNTNLLF